VSGRVSGAVPRAVSVVTAAPRGGSTSRASTLGYPFHRGASAPLLEPPGPRPLLGLVHRSGGLVALAARAGPHAPAQGQLAQPPVGGDPALALGGLAPLPAAVLQQLPGLGVVGQDDVPALP